MTIARLLHVAIAATLLFPSTTPAQDRSAPNPCVTRGASVEPTLRPLDEASRRPDFLNFRRQLQDAVARRDERALLASVHPNVRISFGDSGGIQAFRKEVAPYTFAAWPNDLGTHSGTRRLLMGRILADAGQPPTRVRCASRAT